MSRLCGFSLKVGGTTSLIEYVKFDKYGVSTHTNKLRAYFATDSEYYYILVSDTGTQGGARLALSGFYWNPTMPSSLQDSVINYVANDYTGESEPAVSTGGYTFVQELISS